LSERPDSAQGWYLLGRLYISQAEFTKAVLAFRKANQLTPQQPPIMMAYAESLFLTHGKRLTPLASQLLHQILLKTPNNLEVLNLLAVDAYNKQQFLAAVNYWEQLVYFLDPASKDAKVILQAIATAQMRSKLLHDHD
jgi:cytochrome c-type biogenesis protein CcmH/NrfG